MRLCARRRITWIGLGAMLAMLIALPTLHPYGGAQAQPTFSTGSLMGTYASVAQAREGRSPAASLRLLTFDGNGGFTGTSHTNGLGPFFDERQDVDVNIDGTYSLDPEGTGTGTLTATFPDGTVTTATFHLLVTRASATTNGLAASEVTLVWDNLGPRSGGLVTEVWSRQVE